MTNFILFAALVIVGLTAVAVMLVVLYQRRDSAPINTPPRQPISPMNLRPDIEEEVRRLLDQGLKIEAIKLVRQHTRLGLKEAKDYVEAMPTSGFSAPPEPASLSPQGTMEDEVRDLLRQGKKIEAIKLVRQHTRLGLKEAKDYVEAMPTSGFYAPPAPGPVSLSAPLDIEAQVIVLLRQGLKIEAIKLVRQHARLGLKEAKDYVDALEASNPK